MTGQTELDAIAAQAAAASVEVGSYGTVSFDHCAPGKNGETKMPEFAQGTFSVPSENKTYATDADDASVIVLREVQSEGVADAGFAAIGKWSCSSKRVLLRTPIVVTEKEPTVRTVVVDKDFSMAGTW